jgi:hypothetical protein
VRYSDLKRIEKGRVSRSPQGEEGEEQGDQGRGGRGGQAVGAPHSHVVGARELRRNRDAARDERQRQKDRRHRVPCTHAQAPLHSSAQ